MLLQSQSVPEFDRARLADVVRGSAIAPAEFLADFRRATERDAAGLLDAVHAGETAQVARLAHRIEGACMMIGAARFSDACAGVAAAAGSGNADAIRAAVASFIESRRALYAFMGVPEAGGAGADPLELPGREHARLCAGLVFLVVEDHDFQRETIVRQLRQFGASEVHGFAGGEDALRVARGPPQPAAIMVLDMAMSSMDGVEVAKIAGAERLPLANILHSAQPEEMLSAQIETARACGAIVLGALGKPLTAVRLAPLITRHRQQLARLAPESPAPR